VVIPDILVRAFLVIVVILDFPVTPDSLVIAVTPDSVDYLVILVIADCLVIPDSVDYLVIAATAGYLVILDILD